MLRIRRTKPEGSELRSNNYWNLHVHSRFSNGDALPRVEDLVARAVELGQPALGISDHGNMAASVQLYTACKKAGIAAFPGTEFYMVPTIDGYRADWSDKSVKATRFHLGVYAYSEQGYRNLVALNTLAHAHHFHKPLLDFDSLAEAHMDGKLEGLAAATGCYFGYLTQQLITRGYDASKQWLKTLDRWFDTTYVEMQNHNIDHDDGWTDDEIADTLMELADELGLPAIITQDSHYINPSDREAHDTLKRLVAFGPDPDDAVFPGDGFHLADATWFESHHQVKRRERGCEGLADLLKSHRLSIPVLDNYRYAVPDVVKNPQRVLTMRCSEELQSRAGEARRSTLPHAYDKRLLAELKVIEASGMAGYLLLTANICNHMQSKNILYQTRGSAAGSLVCWLLGITNVDPIKHGLKFERFLSTDRTKPPDIDLDIEHTYRQEVIEWLHTKYSVHQISTWMQYSLEGEDDKSKGSLRVRYFANASKTGGATTWNQIPAGDRRALHDLGQRELYSGLGKNAAGVVITEKESDFSELVPLHHMASGPSVAQYNKNDVESLGLVKLDVLGSKTLTIMRQAIDSIGEKDLGFIPFTDSKTFTFIRQGDTTGIFQLEGGTTRRGLKALKPTKLDHVIAAMALFRPAIMRSGATDSYIARKNGAEKITQRHPIIDDATKETQGILLYQEQTLDIVRALGMDVEDLNTFLKAVKASNKDIDSAGEVIEHYMGWLKGACQQVGMSESSQKWVKEAILGFSEYSFNKAHATVYGITAYQCAYLCVHHPLEFHNALLNVSTDDADKEKNYIRAARNRGIKIRRPDINLSSAHYTIDDRHNCIRKGFHSIAGVGLVAAEELMDKQPYASLDDLAMRVSVSKCNGTKTYRETKNTDDINGVVAKLWHSGCLESILPESARL